MRGKFLGSKKCLKNGDRMKHLVEFEDKTYSILYSQSDIEFRVGEIFDNEKGYWKTDEFGSFQLGSVRKMIFADAQEEFEK